MTFGRPRAELAGPRRGHQAIKISILSIIYIYIY